MLYIILGRAHQLARWFLLRQLKINLIYRQKNFREIPPGDVYQKYAETQALLAATGYKPEVDVKEDVAISVTRYRDFYNK